MSVESEGALNFRTALLRGERPGKVRSSRLDPRVFTTYERVFLFFSFTCFTGVTTFGSTREAGDASSNPVNLACNVIILCNILVLFVMHWRQLLRLAWRTSPILILAFWALTSTAWSIDPGVTFRRVGTMVLSVLVAYYVVTRMDMRTIIHILGHSFLAIAVASAIVCVVWPSIGVMNDPTSLTFNAWRGVMPVKNTLGWITFGGVQVYAWRVLVERDKRVINLAIILFFCFVAVKSKSDTATLSIPLSILALPILQIRRWRSVVRVWVESFAVMGAIAVAIIISFYFAPLLIALGKDPTLTGRVPLWKAAIQMIEVRPFLGYGYYAFWVDNNPAFHWVIDVIRWEAPDAHNAYIDLALEIGLPGAILGTSILLYLLYQTTKLCRTSREEWVTYAAMFTIVFAVTNLVDTRLFRSGDPFCFIMALCYFAVMKLKIEQREKAKTESDDMKRHWEWRLMRRRNLELRSGEDTWSGHRSEPVHSQAIAPATLPAEPTPETPQPPRNGLKFRSISSR
jgi:exopolysaccharide production protein ExoQ